MTMANRQVSVEPDNDDDSIIYTEGRRLRRLGASIFDLLPRQLSRQTDRQSLHTAFIQSAAILFVIVGGACTLLAYRILEPFLRSILWSILAGAFLFPFKYRLTSTVHSYLRQLDTDSHLLLYGLLILLPLRTIDRTIESIGQLYVTKWKPLLLILIILPSIELLQTGVIYRWISTIANDIFINLIYIVHLADSPLIIALVVGYIIAVFTVYEKSPLVTTLLNFAAIPIWFILLIYLSHVLPVNYRVPVVILLIVLTVVGLAVDFREHIDQNRADDSQPRRKSFFTNLIESFSHLNDRHGLRAQESMRNTSDTASSTPYFYFIFWSLLAIKVYQFYWCLILIPIFVIIYRQIKFSLIQIWNYLLRQEQVQSARDQVLHFLQVRRDVLTPSPLHRLVQFLIKGDKKFNHGLQASIDFLVSACMIVTLLLAVLFGSIFLIIQIRHESIHMIKVTSNLVNETMTLQPAFQHMLPNKERMGDLMDTAMNKFYVVGKSWITKQVNTLGQDTQSNAKLEEEALQLWDRLYTYMLNTSTLFLSDEKQSVTLNSPFNRSLIAPTMWQQIQRNFDFSELYRLIQNNLGLLRTVFDSVWSNATLLLTLLSTTVSILFSGGFAVVNFLVSFIVFVTVLFYLLSHSAQPVYRPTEWLNSALAFGGKGLGKAVNDAVTSVFVASLKMAAFYGLYTYVLHIVVGSNLVFLPAVIATVCAVTLKSYWAALPGCLDLWLVQRRPIGALLLLLGQMLPVYVVDTAIYSEVKGGAHQYLTALALAGGVYYRGIEGALIGPIVLCCLLVGVRLYNETMARTLSEEPQAHTPIVRRRTRSLNRSRSLQLTVPHINN